MADQASSPKKLSQDRTDAGKWKSSSTKGGNQIPALSNNPYSCSCKHCKVTLKQTRCWTEARKETIKIDLKIGDRVLVQGRLPGVIKYIGDLDSNYTNSQIYIGVKLDDPVGEHDGVFESKRFFECPQMHGVIVPIEEVHLLLPADGRTVTVKKPLSMPVYLKTDSLSSLGFEESPGDVLHAMSESRLATLLPENQRRVCFTGTEGKPKTSSKECYKMIYSGSSFTRDKAMSSDPDGADQLLKNTPQQNYTLSHSQVDDKVEKQSHQNSIIVPLKPASSAVHSKALNKNHPPSSSTSAVHSLQCRDKVAVMTGSKSASTDLRKLGSCIGKIIASKIPAQSGKVTAPEFCREKESVEVSNGDNGSCISANTSDPGLPTASDSGSQHSIHKVTSYTSRLFSGLPHAEAMTPISGSATMNDTLEFQKWAKLWGGGAAGWTKAHTLQKLKNAQRKGLKEMEWQRKIEQLEKNEKFAPQVKRISTLREELRRLRRKIADIRGSTLNKRQPICTDLSMEVERMEAKVKALRETNESLAMRAINHQLVDTVNEALQVLGIEFEQMECTGTLALAMLPREQAAAPGDDGAESAMPVKEPLAVARPVN